MFKVFYSSRYKKSLKKIKVSGNFNQSILLTTIDILSLGAELPTAYRDHRLYGDLSGYRECHIKSDLILIYEIDRIEMNITLVNIGSHSDLFG